MSFRLSARFRRIVDICAILVIMLTAACSERISDPNELLDLAFVRVNFDVGMLSTCAIDESGRAWCWGSNYRGQLGNGTTSDQPVPVPVSGDHEFVSISVNDWTHCALDNTGVAWCWGDNQGGQLGAGWHKDLQDGLEAYSTTPQRVIAAKPFIAITAAGIHNCGLAVDGTAYCWGSNAYGALGTPTGPVQNDTAQVVSTTLRFRTLTAKGFSVCGISASGAGYCWGGDYGSLGVLGNGTVGNRYTPTRIATDNSWAAIHPGQYLACGVTTAEQLLCWGAVSSIRNGRLWVAEPIPFPQAIGTASPVTSIGGTCMTLRPVGAACLTSVVDSSGNRSSLKVEAVPGTIQFVSVAGSSVHACGQTADGRLYCWGYNSHGQVGDGTTMNRAFPTLVSGNISWRVGGSTE
jgi:alpha-tubulin suppressor-like RCC1 family protein